MLIVTGPSAAGKTTLGRIATREGLTVIEGTDLVKNRFDEEHRPDEDLIAFCTRKYTEAGEDTFAIGNYDKLLTLGIDFGKTVFIGPRAAGEIRFFKERIAGTSVLAIYADLSIRHGRALLRDRKDCPKSLAGFLQRDMREHLMGLARALTTSVDIVRFNNGSLEEFEALVQAELRIHCGN
jgi:dephospho-CoA kinase